MANQKPRKKILFIVTLAEMGGAQKYIRDITEALHTQYDISIAANNEDDHLFEWAKKHKVKTLPLSRLSQKLWLGFLPTPKDFLSFWDIFLLCKAGKYDIVHLNSSKIGLLGAIAAKLAKIEKVVFTAHGWVFNEPESIGRSKNKKWVWILVSKIAALFQDQIINVSQYDLEQATRYHIAPPRKLFTIYNGYDRRKVRFLSAEKARNWLKEQTEIDSTKTVIGTIANHYPTKDLPTMMRSLKHLSENVVLVIIGQKGPVSKEKLERVIRKNNLKKRVFLLTDTPNAAQYLRAFDIYAISSVKEGLPYSTLEAMAAGIPITTTLAGGLRDIFSESPASAKASAGKAALIFKEDDDKALAQNIKKIVGDKTLQKNLTKNAERILKDKFSLDEMIVKTRWIWEL